MLYVMPRMGKMSQHAGNPGIGFYRVVRPWQKSLKPGLCTPIARGSRPPRSLLVDTPDATASSQSRKLLGVPDFWVLRSYTIESVQREGSEHMPQAETALPHFPCLRIACLPRNLHTTPYKAPCSPFLRQAVGSSWII